MDKLLTAKEVAELLNIDESTVYKWVDEHRLGYIDLGRRYGRRCLRFKPSDIERMISTNHVQDSPIE